MSFFFLIATVEDKERMKGEKQVVNNKLYTAHMQHTASNINIVNLSNKMAHDITEYIFYFGFCNIWKFHVCNLHSFSMHKFSLRKSHLKYNASHTWHIHSYKHKQHSHYYIDLSSLIIKEDVVYVYQKHLHWTISRNYCSHRC